MDKRIVLVDSQYLTRISISAVVGSMKGLVITKTLNYPHEVVSEINSTSFEILITEYSDDHQDQINEILRIVDTIKIPTLVVTNSENTEVIQRLLKSDIKGVITKNCSQEEIELALSNVAEGKRFYCNNVLDIVMDKQHTSLKKSAASKFDLSSRELEVLELIVNGFTTKQIADQLHLSIHTINSHRKNLLKKSKITSPAHLAAFAIESGLVNMFE
ncbi:response regulator transcription factor [Fulvivirga lutimaris]|uniref:response regulator transcription factor n=1 Tax=Fulvivirga lutimaris TaxID=1819566 RepID=UPI0012BD12B4|nr:response regulator transcription factor [Fulvivirga lutimaris]MTI39841.1 response regulator transcription factor [Fulvivirga lutimaris]